MNKFSNFLKFFLVSIIGVVSLSAFSQTEGVKADSLKHTSPNVMDSGESFTITNTFIQRANIVPESKTIKNHFVTYSKN